MFFHNCLLRSHTQFLDDIRDEIIELIDESEHQNADVPNDQNADNRNQHDPDQFTDFKIMENFDPD